MSVSTQDLIQRIDELESRLAFQDDLLETLNGQVTALQRSSDLQQEQLRYLHGRLKALEESGRGGPAQAADWTPEEERPPHY